MLQVFLTDETCPEKGDCKLVLVWIPRILVDKCDFGATEENLNDWRSTQTFFCGALYISVKLTQYTY